MKIKSINYYSVSKNESSICDCCGKAIRNICCVTTVENEHLNFGTTCFTKIIKDRLQGFHQKKLQKIAKSIKKYCDARDIWINLTEEEYRKNLSEIPFAQWDEEEKFCEYKDWILNELIPHRIADEEKNLEKYKKNEFSYGQK